jgi:transcriptional regulator with XRE-family HTH domain
MITVSDTDGYVMPEERLLMRVLGDELRSCRLRRGLTRKQLNRRLPSEISMQTLATYELGTRQCSIVRLFEICGVLGTPPQDLMSRVYERVHANTKQGSFLLNLSQVVRNEHPELTPLRRWAKTKLWAGDTGAVRLSFDALENLAGLCALGSNDLIILLGELTIRPLDADDDQTAGARDEG